MSNEVLDSPVQREPAAPSPSLHGIGAVPESAGVKSVDFNKLVDEHLAAKEPPAAVPPADPAKPAPVSADDAKPAPKGLAARILEKNRPAAPAAKPADSAPKPPAPAATEVLPEDKIQLDPAKTSIAARDGFKTLHGITKTLRQQNAEREGELTRLRGEIETLRKSPTPVDQAELAKLREEHKHLSDELLVTRLERHPAFQAQYVAPKQEAVQAAKEILGEKGGEVEKLLGLPRAALGKAVQELTKDLPDMDRLDAAAQIKRAWELEQGGKQALAQSKQTAAGIATRSADQNKAVFKERFSAMVPTAAEFMVRLEAPAGASAEERAGVDAYNSAMQAIETEAEKIALQPSDENTIADHSIKSALYDFHIRHALPRIEAEFEQMQQIIAAQKTEIDGFRARNPNRELRGAPAGGEPAAAATKDMNIEQLAEHFSSGAHRRT